MPLSKQEAYANERVRANGIQSGSRHANPEALKGSGFYGALPTTDGSGRFSTEISGEQNGLEFPLIHQGIAGQDLRTLLHGGPIDPALYDQAEAAARGRLSLGLPAFALEGEQSPRSQIGMPPPQYGVHSQIPAFLRERMRPR